MPQALAITQHEQLSPRRESELSSPNLAGPPKSIRNHLPDERRSITHKFQVGSHEGYLVVGLYPDGQPGEIFITMAKEGSTVSGLVNSFAQAISIGLQHGVSLKIFCDKFSFTRFEPSGWTGNAAIPQTTSVLDYIFRYLQMKFVGGETVRGDSSDVFSSSCDRQQS